MSVFVNRSLDLKRVKWIGFDMDHTLIRYHVFEFESEAYRQICQCLVERKSYPTSVRDLVFEPDRIIRGLVIDRERGNLLKLNLYGRIRAASHGDRKLPIGEVRSLYRGSLLDLYDANFAFVDTAYSLSTACLFSQLVQLRDAGEALPEYRDILADVVDCCDWLHVHGPLKAKVLAAPSRFLKRDSAVIERLYAYREAGKRLFVVTNSGLHYTQALFKFAIEPYLRPGHEDLFEFVITSARKPDFFYGADQPEGGWNTERFMVGGSAQAISQVLDVRNDEILYIGDHIYGDIVQLKKACAWRTALVIDELDHELRSLDASRPEQNKIDVLMKEKVPLEVKLHSGLGDRKQLWTRIVQIDRKLGHLIRAYQSHFNAQWGELMRVGTEESFFAGQVARYACIYARTLGDILESSPLSYFRPARRPLPHDAT